MKPETLGEKYNKISSWWNDCHKESQYGVNQVKRALNFCTDFKDVLDIGCGSGGRFVSLFENKNFRTYTGVDVSSKMIEIAKENHPNYNFINKDFCKWETNQKFDFILAWDSLFHLPLSQQENTIKKICSLLNKNGVLIYTFGDSDYGDHEDQWHNDTFYYSSIGIDKNLSILLENNLVCKHLEFDQFPQNHVYTISIKK